MKDYYERMTPEQARAFKDDMTAELVMSLLIIRDAAKAPELFEKSANVYVRSRGRCLRQGCLHQELPCGRP